MEVMVGSPSIKKQIQDNEAGGELYNTIREGAHYGMVTLNQALQHHCSNGLITQDEALSATGNPTELKQLLRSADRANDRTPNPTTAPNRRISS